VNYHIFLPTKVPCIKACDFVSQKTHRIAKSATKFVPSELLSLLHAELNCWRKL